MAQHTPSGWIQTLCTVSDPQPPSTNILLLLRHAGWPHAITVVYPLPASSDEDALASAEAKLSDSRTQLHQRLGA